MNRLTSRLEQPDPDRCAPRNVRNLSAGIMLEFSTLASLWREFLEVVAPSHCVECGRRISARAPLPLSSVAVSEMPLCADCDLALPWWRRVDGCPRCGAGGGATPSLAHQDPFLGDGDACPGCLSGGSALHRCHALLRYEGAIRRWVPAFKNPTGPFGPGLRVSRAIDYLADELGRTLLQEAERRIDVLVPIPLHPRRQRQRGFNQAELIAHRIARQTGLESNGHTLERIRATRPQASLEGRSRFENIRAAFRATGRLERNCRIGLVDDVLTTGNTLEAAANALLEAGALEVRGITLAATLPHSARRIRRHARAESGAYSPAASVASPGCRSKGVYTE